MKLTHYEELLLEEYLDSLPCENSREEIRPLLIKRLEEGEPIAYILGKQYFYNLHFKVTPDVLIPRPDTERLIELSLKMLPQNAHIIDLGTGSGCIVTTLLYNRADVSATALDKSSNALKIAKENAALWGVESRISFVCDDILSSPAVSGSFDAVISNPPYIKTGVIKDYPSLSYEPIMALDGGADGMIFYRRIIDEYSASLKDGGIFIFEIGFDQADDIKALAKEKSLDAVVYKDYSSNDRVAIIKKT